MANEDYSFIDEYIQNSLDNYRKQVFGNYDEDTGYFEEATPEKSNDEESQPSDEADDMVYNDDDAQQSEEDVYNSVFPEDSGYIPQMGSASSMKNAPTSKPGFRSFGTYQEGRQALLNQLKLYQTGKSKTGVRPDTTLLGAMSIYAPSSDGNDPKHYAEVVAKHVGATIDTPISNIDINKWADAITQMEGNKVGNNPGNLRYQYGGIPIAHTRQQQYTGLNDDSMDELILPLEGENTIRGLDSGRPVMVQDSRGKRKMLYGSSHTTKMRGKVYEKKY